MTCDAHCDFNAEYACSALPAVRAVERDVLGCDYGATSWTTREQAERLMSLLSLDSSTRLLDVGSGSGWPGLYLSKESNCNITLLDMPLVGLEQSLERAASDSMIQQVSVINGSGTSLPFADSCFDRLSHSDVLCCLPEKLEMLQECRRVAATGALMGFFVIEPATGLSDSNHEKAVAGGPPFVDVPEGYQQLLRESGWQLSDRIDITEEFADTIQRQIAGLRQNTPELQEAYGADELRQMWEQLENDVKIVQANLLQRFIYVASAINP